MYHYFFVFKYFMNKVQKNSIYLKQKAFVALYVFKDTLNQFNASLLNKIINFLKICTEPKKFNGSV